MTDSYDAILVVSFGGPEGMDEVMPFLERVVAGRNVPRERLEEVAHHYALFDGVSPINAQNRALIAALDAELRAHGHKLPIYWGNRNWHPLLPETLDRMRADGIRRALAFVTSAYSSYSGCRQYRESIERARAEIGPGAPAVDKLRAFFNHPGFVEPNADRLRAALDAIPPERRSQAHVAFTAHSVPLAMAAGSAYEAQLAETSRLVAEQAGIPQDRWRLVYQSRSGPPGQPWLEPDIGDHLHALGRQDVADVVIAPIGFISDHIEVLYDLDHEAREIAEATGIHMVRAATVGTDPRFIAMIRELIEERLGGSPVRRSIGRLGPVPDICPADCCVYAPRPAAANHAASPLAKPSARPVDGEFS
jgi:ferrochelatase